MRPALTAMTSAMAEVDGGWDAQLEALQARIKWDGQPVRLTLPMLCFALPPGQFDSAYKSKQLYTENGTRRADCQVLFLL